MCLCVLCLSQANAALWFKNTFRFQFSRWKDLKCLYVNVTFQYLCKRISLLATDCPWVGFLTVMQCAQCQIVPALTPVSGRRSCTLSHICLHSHKSLWFYNSVICLNFMISRKWAKWNCSPFTGLMNFLNICIEKFHRISKKTLKAIMFTFSSQVHPICFIFIVCLERLFLDLM